MTKEERDKKKFWVVWNPRGYIPMNRHFVEQEAIDESERLAQKHPNQPLFVLESCGFSKITTPTTFTYAED